MNPRPWPASLPKKFPPAFPSRESAPGRSVSPNASNPAADQSTSSAPDPLDADPNPAFPRAPPNASGFPYLPRGGRADRQVGNRGGGAAAAPPAVGAAATAFAAPRRALSRTRRETPSDALASPSTVALRARARDVAPQRRLVRRPVDRVERGGGGGDDAAQRRRACARAASAWKRASASSSLAASLPPANASYRNRTSKSTCSAPFSPTRWTPSSRSSEREASRRARYAPSASRAAAAASARAAAGGARAPRAQRRRTPRALRRRRTATPGRGAAHLSRRPPDSFPPFPPPSPPCAPRIEARRPRRARRGG